MTGLQRWQFCNVIRLSCHTCLGTYTRHIHCPCHTAAECLGFHELRRLEGLSSRKYTGSRRQHFIKQHMPFCSQEKLIIDTVTMSNNSSSLWGIPVKQVIGAANSAQTSKKFVFLQRESCCVGGGVPHPVKNKDMFDRVRIKNPFAEIFFPMKWR